MKTRVIRINRIGCLLDAMIFNMYKKKIKIQLKIGWNKAYNCTWKINSDDISVANNQKVSKGPRKRLKQSPSDCKDYPVFICNQ